MRDIEQDSENLINYAKEKLELAARDREYKSNRLLDILQSGLEGEDLEDAVYGELSLLPSEMGERYAEYLGDKYAVVASFSAGDVPAIYTQTYYVAK